MKKGPLRTFLLVLRIAISLGVLAGSAQLVYWNRTQDPRFWAFLETPPGKLLLQALRWRGKIPDADENIRLTAEEEKLRQKTEKGIASVWPTARVTLRNGRTRIGHVIAADPRSIVFEDSWSSGGRISSRIALSEVTELTAYREPPPQVSPRDIKFLLEQPEFHLYRFPPFTVVTDESFSSVSGYVRELERLGKQIENTFADFITRTNRVDGIQVLVFSNEAAYQAYQRKHAPLLDNTAGFYAVMLDRLVLFNQVGSDAVQGMRDVVASATEEFLSKNGGRQELDRAVREQERKMLRQIDRHSRQLSMQVLRHEGAHQLFHSLGIHSTFHAENIWLMEGLAMYCEGDFPGMPMRRNAQLVLDAIQRRTHIPFRTLVNHRSSRGLLSFDEQSPQGGALAYAESWALVHYLLHSDQRSRFEAFLHHIRQREHLHEVATTPQFDLLIHFLQIDGETLEKNIQHHLYSL